MAKKLIFSIGENSLSVGVKIKNYQQNNKGLSLYSISKSCNACKSEDIATLRTLTATGEKILKEAQDDNAELIKCFKPISRDEFRSKIKQALINSKSYYLLPDKKEELKYFSLLGYLSKTDKVIAINGFKYNKNSIARYGYLEYDKYERVIKMNILCFSESELREINKPYLDSETASKIKANPMAIDIFSTTTGKLEAIDYYANNGYLKVKEAKFKTNDDDFLALVNKPKKKKSKVVAK